MRACTAPAAVTSMNQSGSSIIERPSSCRSNNKRSHIKSALYLDMMLCRDILPGASSNPPGAPENGLPPLRPFAHEADNKAKMAASFKLKSKIKSTEREHRQVLQDMDETIQSLRDWQTARSSHEADVHSLCARAETELEQISKVEQSEAQAEGEAEDCRLQAQLHRSAKEKHRLAQQHERLKRHTAASQHIERMDETVLITLQESNSESIRCLTEDLQKLKVTETKTSSNEKAGISGDYAAYSFEEHELEGCVDLEYSLMNYANELDSLLSSLPS